MGSKTSIGEFLRHLTVMFTTVMGNLEKFSKVGVTKESTQLILDDKDKLQKLEVEQEQIKARLKAITKEQKVLRSKLEDDESRQRKFIKMEIPQVEWISYDILDRQ